MNAPVQAHSLSNLHLSAFDYKDNYMISHRLNLKLFTFELQEEDYSNHYGILLIVPVNSP